MSERELIDLFRVWLKETECLSFTGRTKNYKKLSFPLIIFQAFAADINSEWLKNHFKYKISTVAGALAKIFPVFRDKVLLQGLREFRAEELGVGIDQVPEMKYMWKGANQTHKNGEQHEISPRAVLEWEATKPIVPGMSRGNLGAAAVEYESYMEESVCSADNDVCVAFKIQDEADLETDYVEALTGLYSLAQAVPKKRKCSAEARAQKKQKTAEQYGQTTLWAFAR